MAEGALATSIQLTWRPPLSIGSSAITGYEYRWKPNGLSPVLGMQRAELWTAMWTRVALARRLFCSASTKISPSVAA